MPTTIRSSDETPFRRRTLLGGLGATAVVGLTGTSAYAAATDSAQRELGVVVRNTRVGTGMPMVGYNTGHYLPGSNTSAWLAYSRVNAVRFFASLSEWTPDEAVDPGDGVETVADFDARKAELRRDPENNPFLRWDLLEDRFENHVYSITNHYRLNYQVSELRRLGITPITRRPSCAGTRRGPGSGGSGRSTTPSPTTWPGTTTSSGTTSSTSPTIRVPRTTSSTKRSTSAGFRSPRTRSGARSPT